MMHFRDSNWEELYNAGIFLWLDNIVFDLNGVLERRTFNPVFRTHDEARDFFLAKVEAGDPLYVAGYKALLMAKLT